MLSVTTAAIICGILNGLLEKSKTIAPIVKLLTALFMSVTVLSPLVTISISNMLPNIQSFTEDANQIVQQGEWYAEKRQADIIKSRLEAYILDKAASLDAEVTVEITLSQDSLPCAVCITGNLSPYAKAQLENILQHELAIPKEAQRWIG